MAQYSIKELEQLSGIKAHTIRMWEQRYNIVIPKRTSTNIRLYSDADLKKIIGISMLQNAGFRISKIAGMSNQAITRKVLEINNEDSTDASVQIAQLVVAMVDMEEESFEKILSRLFLLHGFEKTITETVYRFLEKIGVLWLTNNINPAQEHFITNLIRQKIIVAIDSLPIPSKKARSVVLYLRENELHEIGLLFWHYLVRKTGFRTYYLGQNVPYEDLKQVVKTHKPDKLLTLITTPLESVSTEFYLKQLSKDFSHQKIIVSGRQVASIRRTYKNLILCKDSNELLKYLSSK